MLVVQDKKIKRYGLVGAIKTNWERKQKLEAIKAAKAKADIPKVTKVEERLDTLKAAAKQSYRAPQADHDSLLQQVKGRAADATTSSLTIKDTTEESPHWTHVAGAEVDAAATAAKEPAPPQADAPEPASATPRPAATQRASHTVVQETTSQPPAEHITPSTPPPAPTPAETEPTPQQPTATAPKPSATTSPTTAPESETALSLPNKPAKKKRVGLRLNLARFAEPILKVMPWVGAAVLIITLVGGGTWYFMNRPADAPVVTTTPTQGLIAAEQPEVIVLTETNENPLSIAYNTMISTASLTAYTVVLDDDMRASVSELLAALELRVSGSFGRSIRELTFGSHRGTEPYVVLSVSNFDTAFAGMLQWEQSMSIDLEPLFGPAVRESFDESARTVSQVRSSFFKDAIVANTSVRILVDDTNTERIVYGFVDPFTILITTTSNSYERLIPALIR